MKKISLFIVIALISVSIKAGDNCLFTTGDTVQVVNPKYVYGQSPYYIMGGLKKPSDSICGHSELGDKLEIVEFFEENKHKVWAKLRPITNLRYSSCTNEVWMELGSYSKSNIKNFDVEVISNNYGDKPKCFNIKRKFIYLD